MKKDQITVTNDEVVEQVRKTKGLLPDNMSFNGYLAQQGMDKGQFIQQLASAIQVNKFFQKRVPPHEPSATDIGKYFRENKDKFFIPAAVDAQHFMIVVDENDTGDAITKKRNQMTRYLEQIFQRLRRAGLVVSKRGPGGGYSLARPAGEILLSEVIVAVEGSLLAVSDAAGTGSASPEFVWEWMRQSLAAALEEITVASLCQEAARRGLRRADAEPPMYEI